MEFTVTTKDGKEFSTTMNRIKAREVIESIDTTKDIKMIPTDGSEWYVIPGNTVKYIVFKEVNNGN